MTDLPCHVSPRLAGLATVAHGFFGRRGGVSTGIYASLNAGPGSDDLPDAVAQNRARIAAAIGAPGPDALMSCHQVHGTAVIEPTHPWRSPPRADAMVTDRPGLALCILTADCVPLLMADATAGVIAAVHAGWKGALSGVAEAAVDAMVGRGADPGRIAAAIGPCIHVESYEVGPEFRDRFLADAPWSETLFQSGQGDRWHFDLPGFLSNRLVRAGIGAVDRVGPDTCTAQNDYFSNRRRTHAGEPDYGRNASVILLKT